MKFPPSSRILVRGLNWLGDAVMSTPALNRLREAYPEAHLALLTEEALAPLYENHPAVNEVICIQNHDSPLRTARSLRSFDAALLLPNSFRAAWEVFLGRIPHRFGYGANGRRLLLTRCIPRPSTFRPMRKRSRREIQHLIQADTPGPPPPTTAHHIHHYLHLAGAAGASTDPCPPQLVVTAPELDAFRSQFNIPTHATLLGLCPGAEYGASKRWPADRFAAAAAAIQKAHDCHWILFGTDTSLGKHLSLAQPGYDLTGRTSLRQLLAGLKLCGVVLTNDSGPMHAAAALGTPVVVPFGSTSPELTGPGLPGSPAHALLKTAVPCAPCFLRDCPIDHRCMNNHLVETVVRAALDQLGRGN